MWAVDMAQRKSLVGLALGKEQWTPWRAGGIAIQGLKSNNADGQKQDPNLETFVVRNEDLRKKTLQTGKPCGTKLSFKLASGRYLGEEP
ncbi:hypothetical protein NDU88_006553 [Pleurodeles waltl]|uniref:Uncharacterized protein n=1 Tax=Pleurodeles waltl TaxID=8319 RepID=A0AAV7QPD2_PLEWA|nr:hypothetical protein NDU88_006553 [Pleurodeles waltl]